MSKEILISIRKEHNDNIFAGKNGKSSLKRRQYYRYCQMCGEKCNQKDMVRIYETPSINWVCQDCYDREYGIFFEIEEFQEDK